MISQFINKGISKIVFLTKAVISINIHYRWAVPSGAVFLMNKERPRYFKEEIIAQARKNRDAWFEAKEKEGKGLSHAKRGTILNGFIGITIILAALSQDANQITEGAGKMIPMESFQINTSLEDLTNNLIGTGANFFGEMNDSWSKDNEEGNVEIKIIRREVLEEK